MNKVIFVADLDSFFASVEEAKDPALRGKPIGVGHELNGKGVIVTANYLAKEKGAYAGMPFFKAKQVITGIELVQVDFDSYLEYSEKTFQIVKKYSDSLELGSIDEAYIDVTEKLKKSGITSIEYALKIQRDVLRQTGLGISIGISNNRIMAKMASGMDKPKGVTTLWQHELPTKLWNLPLGSLYYIGKKSEEKLNDMGYSLIADIANINKNTEEFEKLENIFGKHWYVMWSFANGISSNKIEDTGEYFAKSIGKSETYPKHLDSYNSQKEQLYKLTRIVTERMKYRNVAGKVIGLSVKSGTTDLGPRQSGTSFRMTMELSTSDFEKIYSSVLQLFEKKWVRGQPIKYFGVSVSGLEDAYYKVEQQTLFDWKEEEYDENQSFKNLIKDLNAMIGYDAVTDADAISKFKKWTDKTLTNDDRMKFKVWS